MWGQKLEIINQARYNEILTTRYNFIQARENRQHIVNQIFQQMYQIFQQTEIQPDFLTNVKVAESEYFGLDTNSAAAAS